MYNILTCMFLFLLNVYYVNYSILCIQKCDFIIAILFYCFDIITITINTRINAYY